MVSLGFFLADFILNDISSNYSKGNTRFSSLQRVRKPFGG